MFVAVVETLENPGLKSIKEKSRFCTLEAQALVNPQY